MIISSTPWFLRRPPPAARLRLFCFAYAGGNAAVYLPWQARIDPAIEICAVQLPGRGARFGEARMTSMAALVAAISGEMDRLGDSLPFAFFGHSLGALVAYELAHWRAARGHSLPRQLIASGCRAPRRRPPPKFLHRMADAPLIEELRRYNGTPPDLLGHPELMALVLPTLRADFQLVADFARPERAPLACPVHVLAGRDDEFDAVDDFEDWCTEGRPGGTAQWFAGDHFFINTHETDVLRAIERLLGEPRRGVSAPPQAA